MLAVKDNELCHADKEPVRAEHWWRIVPIGDSPSILPGMKISQYVVKNITTGRVLWCRTKKQRAGIIDSDGKWDDNHFIFDETKMPGGSGTFRFLCPSTNCVLVSRTDRKPEIDGFELNSDRSPDYEDHHFRLLFEEMDSEIEYDRKSARVINEKPSAIAVQELENLGEVQEVQDLIWNEDITQEHSFEKSEGYEVGGEIGLKIHLVPELIETDVRVKTTTKNDWKTGQKNVETVKWGANLPLAVPAGKTYVAELTATKGTVTMPYTIKSTGKDSGAKSESKGVYNGVQFYKIHTVVYDKENPDDRRVYKDTGNSNKELRSYEPRGEEQESEEKETYGNQGYDESRSFEDGAQQEEYPGVERIYRNSYGADDAENLSYSQRYADGGSYNADEQQKNYPEAGEGELNWQTESYGTDAGREYAYGRQNEDEQEPRLGQAFDDNRSEYERPQCYHGNARNEYRNATDQVTYNDEPVGEYREADDQQTPASYSGNNDAGMSSTQRYQSKEYVEEPSYDSGYQSRALEDDVSDEQSYSYGERNSDTYQQSSSYREDAYGERLVAKGYDYGANSQYGAYEERPNEFSNEGQGQRYDIPYRSYGD